MPAVSENVFERNAGMSGRLRLDDHNRIRRELDWAQIKNGAPAGL